VAAVTYGLRAEGDWQARDVCVNEWGGSDFAVWHAGQVVGQARLRLVGLHNVSNALAVLAVVDRLGLDLARVLEILPRFHGVRRRFEIKGEAQGVTVIDDYAHHPTEIQATLAAARRRFGQRPLWVFFQPHTYSRTRALLDEFAVSFGDADHVLISEIYAAREKDDLGIHARDLVQRVRHPDVRYVATLPEASALLQAELRPGDVLLTLGAGNGDRVGESVLQARRQA
jgi:UDP-N-acetylmuramate--alanine ligase